MGSELLIGLLLIGWLLVAPVLGVIGFARSRGQTREILALREEMARLKRLTPDDSGARRAGSGFQLDPEPELTPDPELPDPELTEDEPLDVPPIEAPPIPAPAPAAMPQQAPRAPELAGPSARPGRDWERMIAANWMVWTGGVALAIGGLFLVRIAIEAGFFGPTARTIAAALFGVGLVGAALRARAMPLVQNAAGQVRYLPSILAGAGIISLYGACLSAGLLYALVPPLLALVLLALVSAAAIALSLIFGPVLAVAGLAGAYCAPFFTGADGGSVLPLLPYIAMITGTGLCLVRLKGWRVMSWVTLGGTAFWALVSLAGGDAGVSWAVPGFVLLSAAMAMVLAEPDARDPLPEMTSRRGALVLLRTLGQSLSAAHVFWALAGGFIVCTGLDAGGAPNTDIALAVFAAAGFLAAWQRVGFALFAPIGAVSVLAALALWPGFALGLGMSCLVAGLGFGLAGSFVMAGQTVKAPAAMSAALVPPVALFIAFWREAGFEPGFVWGLGALGAACGLGFVLDILLRRDPGGKDHPGAAAAYALGAILCAILAPFLVLSGLWLGTAMAVVALGLAVIAVRYDLPLIRAAGPVAVALSVGLLLRPGLFEELEISTTPIFNALTFGYGLAIAALGGGAWFLTGRGRLSRTYQGGALIVGFSLLGLTIRHIAGEGVLDGRYGGMGEAAGYAIAYLGMATSLAWRFRTHSFVWRVAETVALAVGVMAVLLAAGNIDDVLSGKTFLINLFFPAFAMPAILLAVYASVLRAGDRPRMGLVAGIGAMALGFVWVTLETARIVGADQDGVWAYSVAWIVYAFGLLFWGVWKHRATARFASLGILLLAIAKVFLLDMGALEGVARAGSFIGLGAALIGTALFYQRYVFGLRKPAAAPDGQAQ